MNARRLRFWSDAFALLAFVSPLVFILSALFIFKYGNAPSLAWANRSLIYVISALVTLCGFGNVIFIVLGSLEGQRRVMVQGLFGLCVGIMLFVGRAALMLWLLRHSVSF